MEKERSTIKQINFYLIIDTLNIFLVIIHLYGRGL
jgi:hypothetical protein